MKKVIFAGVAAILLAAPFAICDETQQAAVVATVNGEPIYLVDVERGLSAMHSSVAEKQRQAFDIDQLVFRLVNDTLLAQEARQLGMQHEPPIPEKLEARKLILALQELEKREVLDKAVPTDDEVEAFFKDQYYTFTFRMVSSYEKDEAERIRALIDEGADVAATAREQSVDQYSPRGGLVEKVDRIDIPKELSDVLLDLDAGEAAGPIQTKLGWSTVQLVEIKKPDPSRLPGLDAYIRNVLRYRKADEARAVLADNLKESYPTTVHWNIVDAIQCERLPDGRLFPKIDDPQAIVATVDDLPITAGALEQLLKERWKGVRNETAALATRSLVVDRLVRDELMRTAAIKRGYGETPQIQRQLHSLETQLLIPKILSEVVGTGIVISEEEKRAFYAENTIGYSKAPRLHTAQITVETKEEAERLAFMTREGADFAWLAREHSIDRFKKQGGDRGWMVPAPEVDPLQDALLASRIGDILGPFGVPGNFQIVKVDAREEQEPFTYEEVQRNIQAKLYNVKFAEALDDVIQRLRNRSEITVHDEVLGSLTITGEPSVESNDAPAPPHGMPQ